jgi:hypothetical protein
MRWVEVFNRDFQGDWVRVGIAIGLIWVSDKAGRQATGVGATGFVPKNLFWVLTAKVGLL